MTSNVQKLDFRSLTVTDELKKDHYIVLQRHVAVCEKAGHKPLPETKTGKDDHIMKSFS